MFDTEIGIGVNNCIRMKFTYNLEKEDFLTYQLFTSSQSLRIRKKRRRDWLLLTLGSLLLSGYFFYQQIEAMSIYFMITAVIFALFYNRYFNWRYKKHYSTFIDENYKNRFGLESQIEFVDDFVIVKDKTGEGKIKIEEIEKVDNLENHIFIKVSTGTSLIITKQKIDNSALITEWMKSKSVSVNDYKNWKW